MDELPDEMFPVSRTFTNSSEKIDRYEIIVQNQHQKQMSLFDELNSNELQDEYNEIEEKELQRQQEQEENEIRALWKVNDYVLIYSRSNDEWSDGKIVKIDGSNIKRNEWLHIRYGNTKKKTKKIQRNCKDIKPIPADHPIHFNTGSLCLIYSYDVEEWCDGEVENIFTDSEGEWMQVKYDEYGKWKVCGIQRYSDDIKLIVE